jgi:hypothetical protein
MSTLDNKQEEAFGKALVDWGIHPVITQPTEKTLAEIPHVVAAGAPTIKIYMTYRQEGLLIEEPEMRAFWRACVTLAACSWYMLKTMIWSRPAFHALLNRVKQHLFTMLPASRRQ